MASEPPDSYLTLESPCSHEFKIKGSRFIGLAFPIRDVDEALSILENIRKKEHAATHHCFAYVAGLRKEQFKYSDDGEPSGTAGKPIYQAILGRDLTNVIVIVVRYFGGTKLGTGGLARAYSQTAGEVLDKAGFVKKLVCDRLKFSIDFSLYDQVIRLINSGKYTIIDQQFAEQVMMIVDIRKSQTEGFVARLMEMTGGQVEVEKQS